MLVARLDVDTALAIGEVSGVMRPFRRPPTPAP
jgi:hypothetical protein